MTFLDLKLFLRKTKKDKLYLLINTIGLTIGITSVFLLFILVMFEFNYDRFHKNYERIFMVSNEFKYSNGVVNYIMETPGPLAKFLVANYPEIEKSTSCVKFFNPKYIRNNEIKFLKNGYCVNPDFFDLFSFEFISGNKSISLESDNSIIISEKLAKKLFTNENPIGKPITVEGEGDFFVSGILSNSPANSSIMFDFLLPMSHLEKKYNDFNIWEVFGYSTFILLKDKKDATILDRKIKNILKFIDWGDVDVNLFLFPLKGFHFDSDFGLFVENPGDIKNTFILFFLALFILITSIINYINLSIARSQTRQKEIVIKKILGAQRIQLIKQFFAESLFSIFIVSILSLTSAFFLIPKIQFLSGKMLTGSYINHSLILGMLGIIVFASILAGIYPSLHLSSYHPLIAKHNYFPKRSMIIKRGMVLFQFIVVIFVTISVLTIYTQVNFMMNKDLGFTKENLIRLYLGENKSKATEIKNKLLENPTIESVTKSGQFINLTMESSGWNWAGNSQEKLSVFTLEVGNDFCKTMGIDIINGPGFSENKESCLNEVMINESAYKYMGIKDCIGMKIKVSNTEYSVVGIIKDFHFSHLKFDIKPLLLLYSDNLNLTLRVTDNTKNTLNYIKNVYNKFNTTSSPFNYSIVTDDIAALYGDENKLKNSISGFLFVLLFISIISITGMMSSLISNKHKEIGLRKVFGASYSNIILFLLKDILIIVALAFVLAAPIAYFSMEKWLSCFSNHTGISIFTYLLVGLFFISFSFLIVFKQAYKASIISPIKVLEEFNGF